MKLTLSRFLHNENGIFGMLQDDRKTLNLMTLEHAFWFDGLQSYASKVPEGNYRCERGHHTLESGPIETFEVLSVPGHTGILFHIGNSNKDSDGCILIGYSFTFAKVPPYDKGIVPMIANSAAAFKSFIGAMVDVDEFDLTVCRNT